MTTTLKDKLTLEEVSVLNQGLILSGRYAQAIELIEQLIIAAESMGKTSEIPQLREEIQRLTMLLNNSSTTTSTTLSTTTSTTLSTTLNPPIRNPTTINYNNITRHNLTTLQVNEQHSSNHQLDDEIMSLSSTASTVQMNHLSDLLSIRINDIEVS